MLPGHLIAATGAGGRWVAVALLVIAGAGVGAALMVSPPIDAHAAGWRLVIGLTLMFLPAPASRAGSFIPADPVGVAVADHAGAAVLLTLRRALLSRRSGPDSAKQQVVDDPAAPQQLHLPQQHVGGRAVPEGGGR